MMNDLEKNYRKNSDNPKKIQFVIFEIRENHDTYKTF